MINLLVGDHPVSIEQKENWSKLKHIDAVDGKFIIKGWRQLHLIGDDDSLTDPLVEEVESGQDEEDWHSHSVHHGDVNDV